MYGSGMDFQSGMQAGQDIGSTLKKMKNAGEMDEEEEMYESDFSEDSDELEDDYSELGNPSDSPSEQDDKEDVFEF